MSETQGALSQVPVGTAEQAELFQGEVTTRALEIHSQHTGVPTEYNVL